MRALAAMRGLAASRAVTTTCALSRRQIAGRGVLAGGRDLARAGGRVSTGDRPGDRRGAAVREHGSEAMDGQAASIGRITAGAVGIDGGGAGRHRERRRWRSWRSRWRCRSPPGRSEQAALSEPAHERNAAQAHTDGRRSRRHSGAALQRIPRFWCADGRFSGRLGAHNFDAFATQAARVCRKSGESSL